MSRYQCPLCTRMHPIEALPRCPVHGTGHSLTCQSCQLATLNVPCGGGR